MFSNSEGKSPGVGVKTGAPALDLALLCGADSATALFSGSGCIPLLGGQRCTNSVSGALSSLTF